MSLFKSTKKRSLFSRILHACWPVMGIKRTFLYYLHRLKRLRNHPFEVSAGIATGIASSFTPFIGLQIFAALGVNSLFKGSTVSTLVGTLFGNPWTFPFIWFFMFKTGRFLMLHTSVWINWPQGTDLATLPPLSIHFFFTHFSDILLPILIASVPLTLLAWILSFALIYSLMIFLKHRLKRLHSMKHPSKSPAPE